MEEIWKDIEGYEGLYQVSNLGRVRSLDHYVTMKDRWGGIMQRLHKGQMLQPGIGTEGYSYVNLYTDGVVHPERVHRLVARAFVPGWFEGADVNHKDEDKQNNRMDNLEWCTRQYNVNYGTGKWRKSAGRRKRVQQLTLDDVPIATYESTHDAKRKTGFAQSSIAAACRGEKDYINSYGYHWRYID